MELTIKRAKNRKNNWLERAAGDKPHGELQRTQTCGVQAAAQGAKAKLCVPLSSSPPMHRVQGSERGRITVRIPEKFHLCGKKNIHVFFPEVFPCLASFLYSRFIRKKCDMSRSCRALGLNSPPSSEEGRDYGCSTCSLSH